MHILTKKTGKARLQYAIGQRGTPSKMLAGSWLSDLASLGKAIVLCENCNRKWQPSNYHYVASEAVPGYKFVIGDCDACGTRCQGTLFTPERST